MGPVAGAPLRGLQVVEGSAFVAAPLGGMTLAQMGADVIRIDTIGGGLDYRRWPVNQAGNSFFWAGLNKGKRSVVVDMRSPEGREVVQALVAAPGEERGVFLSNFPAKGWLGDDVLRARRSDLVYVNIIGNPDGSTAVDTVSRSTSSGIGLSARCSTIRGTSAWQWGHQWATKTITLARPSAPMVMGSP